MLVLLVLKVILPCLNFLKKNSVIIVLIKTQFESKKNETKKGCS